MTPRVLCAIDFSSSARHAMDAAAELARDKGATLELLHVEDRALWTREPPLHLPGDVRQAMLDETLRQLEAWRSDAELHAPGLHVVARTASGVPADEIVAAAHGDRAIEAIVVGTHGRSGIARAVLGSVAEKVARHAPCSVLLVRPPRG